MSRTYQRFAVAALLWTQTALWGGLAAASEPLTLATADTFDVSSLSLTGAEATVRGTGPDATFAIVAEMGPTPSQIVFTPPEGDVWDLSAFERVSIRVSNQGSQIITLMGRAENPDSDGLLHCCMGMLRLSPGSTDTLTIPLSRYTYREKTPEFVGMWGEPTLESAMDAAQVARIALLTTNPQEPATFTIHAVSAEGQWDGPAEDERPSFFPMIDAFGQYRHKEWPGKITAQEDFAQRHSAEQQDLAAHPEPSDRNQYGGWTAGPQFEATGFFRTGKYEGRWFFIDPEGRLFWSFGINRITKTGDATPLTDRRHYFADLPEDEDAPLGQFLSEEDWAPDGYFADKTPYDAFAFYGANLMRKHGAEWEQMALSMPARRLRSWGFNTIGVGSDPDIYQERRTPYTVQIDYTAPTIPDAPGRHRNFPDPFHPEFRQALREAIAVEEGRSANDPWCIGYFVDNELTFRHGTFLSEAVLQAPAHQPAKLVMRDYLKERYQDIETLNAYWHSDYASWDAFLAGQGTYVRSAITPDLLNFTIIIVRKYFHTVNEEIKRVAPNQLYLGCRFHDSQKAAFDAAAEFCDVISFNRYVYIPLYDPIDSQIDRPTLISEFHFGALDRGPFNPGLRVSRDQNNRAHHLRTFMSRALINPRCIGAHWDQYMDQPTTGRGDGRNGQIGLVDICDTPYQETIDASRDIVETLYDYRLEPHF